MIKFWKQITLTTLLLVAAGCSSDRSVKNMKQNPTSTSQEVLSANTSEIEELEQAIHQQVNEYRRSQNLPPLTLNSTISEEARIHSQNMADSNTLSHNGFKGRVEAIGETIPYRSAAENVATNYGYSDPAARAVTGWINSPGHQQNMVGDFDLTGVGIVETSRGQYYLTQIFIRRP